MRTIRRVLFAVLAAGAAGPVVATVVHPSVYWISSFLFMGGVASGFGLLVWSFAFLGKEKTLTRIALAIVFLFMLMLVILVTNSAD